MIQSDRLTQFQQLLAGAKTILVLQPEHPDTDSLCTALALEHLLGEQGKTVIMYSKGELAAYINYFPGADRLTDEFPNQYDAAILVDCGGPVQMARTLEKYQGRLSAKPFVIIDHHAARQPMPFATIDLIDPAAAATGELIANLAKHYDWLITAEVASLIVPAIMADTLGLTTPSTTPDTIQAVADMARIGANISKLNNARLAASALDSDILTLKGQLLQQVEFFHDGRLALLTVDSSTLKAYAKRYDPSSLVIYEMQHVRGVEVAIVIRNYAPKIKVSFRANGPIAAPIAAELGGGGHAAAAGATVENGDPAEVRKRLIAAAKTVLDKNAT